MELNKQNFQEWLELKRLSPNSLKVYTFYLDKIMPLELNQESINDFLYKHNNIVARAMLKNLLEYLVSIETNKERKADLVDLEIPKQTGRVKKKLPNIINESEVKLITSYMNNERDKIMVLLSFYSALRLRELLNIKAWDFKWERWWRDREKNGRVVVLGKGNKERIVFVVPSLMAKIEEWIKTISDQHDKNKPLFNICARRWQTILAKASQKALGRRVNPHLLRHCVKDNTEILTANGWKKYNEISIGDSVPTLNLKSNQIEFQPIKDIFVYDINNENLLEIKNKYLDYICTPEHKGIFKIAKERQKTINNKRNRWSKWGSWKLKTFDNLIHEKNKRLIKHRISGISDGDFSIGRIKASLIGWILTDGNISKRKAVTIDQSYSANKHKCDIISDLLKESGLEYSEHLEKVKICGFGKKEQQMKHFRIFNKSTKWIYEFINQDRTPKWNLLQLKRDELEAIYKNMMMGDGTRGNELTTQNKKRIDFFRALCCLLGKRTLLGYKSQNGKRYYRTYITNRNNCEIYPKQIKKVKESCKVWCPSIENQTWIARSNEKIFITGNSVASFLLEKGWNLIEIKEYLGHASISSTQIYTHINKEALDSKFWKSFKR